MKKMLVLGAGAYYRRVLQQLSGAGFLVVAADRNPAAPGAADAHRFYPVDIADTEGIVDLARREQVDGIMAVNDFGVPAAAIAAHALGLPGLDPELVRQVTDKGFIRDAWRRAGLAQPDYQVVSGLDEAERAAGRLGYPCVLKPTDCGGGGRGVSVVRDAAGLPWAYAFAKPYVTNGRFIIETFLDGIEMTIDSFTDSSGRCHILAMSDKEKPDLRTRVALSLNYPAFFPKPMLARCRKLVKAAVAAVGITQGMAHTELIVTDQGPKLVEISARGGGGHVFHTIVEAVSGFNAPLLLARLLTGDDVHLTPPLQRGAVYRFFHTPRGILREVRHLKDAARLPGVLDIGMAKRVGDRVGELHNSLHRPGFVVTSGASREEAMARADRVEKMLELIVSPA